MKKAQPLAVGQIVLAIHPLCHHFHRGSILTIDDNTVQIKFFGNDLGVHRVDDTKLSILSGNPLLLYSNNSLWFIYTEGPAGAKHGQEAGMGEGRPKASAEKTASP